MTARFATNEIRRNEHDGCGEMVMMDFPPLHFATPRCVACAVEVFRENGEFTRWLVTMLTLGDSPEADSLPYDEQTFYQMWGKALSEAAFDDSTTL
jgi:hypothetical protein